MTTMIERALQNATITETGEVEELQLELSRLVRFYDSLLPVEEKAKEKVSNEITAKKTLIERLKASEILDLPQLDTAVFGWTKKQRAWPFRFFGHEHLLVPVFAYIPLTGDACVLRASPHGVEERYGSDRPSGVTTQYEKIMNAMVPLLDGNVRAVEISYKYEGVIPAHVREIIQTEQRGARFRQLALVCEVDSWKITKTVMPPRQFLDPILVGEKAGALWVLASFDPTPVEQYLLNEFSTKEDA